MGDWRGFSEAHSPRSHAYQSLMVSLRQGACDAAAGAGFQEPSQADTGMVPLLGPFRGLQDT